MIVRRIRPDEAATAAEIEKGSLSVPWSESELALFAVNPNGIYLAAYDDDKMTGVCGCYAGAGECMITNIAVLPEYRRRGIASLLLTEMLSEAVKRGCEAAFLEVGEANTAARIMYEGFGFTVTGVRKRYYKDCDGLNMRLDLKNR